MEINEKQMEQLVEDVRAQLSELLKAQEAKPVKPEEKLAKAEDEEKKDKKEEEKKDEEKKEEAKKAEDEDKKDEEKKDKEKEKEEEAKKAEEEDKKDEEKKEDKKEDKKEEDKEIDKCGEYKRMSKSERELHYKTLKRLIWEDQGFELKKAEEAPKADELNKAEELTKAEEEIKKIKAENETLKKSFDQLLASLNKVIRTPERKSVEMISEIVLKPGDEPSKLTEPELRDKLNAITRGTKLSKAERNVINDYLWHGIGRDDVLTIIEKAK